MSLQAQSQSPKGRAVAARPLVCLPAALAVLAILASPASAAPTKPRLTGTNPPSPSTSLRPRIVGEAEEGIVISSIVPRSIGGPIHRVTEPTSHVVTIFAEDSTCTDEAAIVAVGSSTELEGSGILVTSDVKTDAETHFYADQTDPVTEETSACSNGIGYRQVTTPPAAPEFTSTSPASPANANTPALIGAAPAGSTVLIYPNASCSGAPVASGPAAAFGAEGITVAVADNTTTVFHGKSEMAGLSSACSTSSIEYQEVTPEEPPVEEPPIEEPPGGGGEPPAEQLPNPPGAPAPPKLRTAPEGTANDNTPTVTGRAPGAARVEVFSAAGCRGDAVAVGSAAQFTSGLRVSVADNSTVSLYGVSIDGGGDRSACSPEPVTYVEDSTPPQIQFTSGPGAKTHKRTVQFTFVDATADRTTSFQCRLDHGRWKACHSPLRLKHLGHRRHRLMVRGVDAAGNVGPVAKRSFKVVKGRR